MNDTRKEIEDINFDMMMKKSGIERLKMGFSAFESVKKIALSTITDGGKPMAKIIPLTEEVESDEIFGLWKEHEDNESVDDFVRKLRKGRKF